MAFESWHRWLLASSIFFTFFGIAAAIVPHSGLFGFWIDFGWTGHIFTAFYLVWMLNLYNFMDGIDGLAGAETASLGAGVAVVAVIAAAAAAIADLEPRPGRAFGGASGQVVGIGFKDQRHQIGVVEFRNRTGE